MKNFYYTVSTFAISYLICSAIFALYVLSQHEIVLLKFGGKISQLVVSNLAVIAQRNEFRGMVIDQPKKFFDNV